jgi:hypothetical protein
VVKYRESTMAEDPPSRVDPNQVAEIVSSYLRHHQIAPDQLAGLIVEVHYETHCPSATRFVIRASSRIEALASACLK